MTGVGSSVPKVGKVPEDAEMKVVSSLTLTSRFNLSYSCVYSLLLKLYIMPISGACH